MNNSYLMQRDYDYIDLQSPIDDLKKMIKHLKQEYNRLTEKGRLNQEVHQTFKYLMHESRHILRLLEFKIQSQQKLDNNLERQVAKFMRDNANPAK